MSINICICKDRSFNKITANWVMTQFVCHYFIEWPIFPFSTSHYCVDRSTVGQRYVSNAAMTLAAISATIPVLFWWYAPAPFFMLQVQTQRCANHLMLRKHYTTVRQLHRSEHFEPNTVLWAFHTILPSTYPSADFCWKGFHFPHSSSPTLLPYIP